MVIQTLTFSITSSSFICSNRKSGSTSSNAELHLLRFSIKCLLALSLWNTNIQLWWQNILYGAVFNVLLTTVIKLTLRGWVATSKLGHALCDSLFFLLDVLEGKIVFRISHYSTYENEEYLTYKQWIQMNQCYNKWVTYHS